MNQQEIFTKMAIANWNLQIARAEKVFNSFSDADFVREIAPGKNRIVYLYGHLAIVHDMMNDILGVGKCSKPELADYFLKNPDDHAQTPLSLAELKAYWQSVHAELGEGFAKLSADDWFKRHNAMTDEDFEKDPTRNKLNVLLNRTGHVAYHLGQVNLVKPKAD